MSKNKILIYVALIFSGLGLLLVLQSRTGGKLRLIACDVGQGDGILILTPNGRQIVIDGGPGTKIVGCLSKYMPFWDRKVELMVSTHPQEDHMQGLISVLNDYKVDIILSEDIANNLQFYSQWKKLISDKKIKVYEPSAGDTLVLDGVTVSVLWPGKEDAAKWRINPPVELNQTGIVTKVSYGQFCAYLTADVEKEILEKIVNEPCAVLKVAHHGSKTATSELLLEEAKPKIALISVGKNNRYGHPNGEVLDLLKAKNIQIERTDLAGDIEVVSDGKSFGIMN